MPATYRMNSAPAASVAGLFCWGPWQDAAGLLSQVPEVRGGVVLALADARSGGLGAAQAGAEIVVADPATVEGAALALSVRACQQLPHASAAALFGEDAFGRRVWFYHHLRPFLPSASRDFWDRHERSVRLGLCGSGRFEQRLRRLRPIWRLGPGPRRARLLAGVLGQAWGQGAQVDASRLRHRSRWWRALADGRPPGLSVELHAAARAVQWQGAVEGAADVVWLGNLLDGRENGAWARRASVAVGWTTRTVLPEVPEGWHLEQLRVEDDSPFARACFVMRRRRGR